MSGSLGYTKKFIILKKDFSNIVGLNPKGHGKIEIKGLKGSLSLSLENAEDNQCYNVLLVFKNKTYDLGKVYTEKSGKGREELTFNLSDLEAKGFSADRINGIIVKRDSNILLGGYMDKEDGSIESFISKIEIKSEPITPSDEPIVGKSIDIGPFAVDMVITADPEEKLIEPIETILEEKTEDAEEVVEEIEYEPEIMAEEVEEEEAVAVEETPEIEQIEEVEEVINAEVEIIEGDNYVPEFEPIADLSQDTEPVAIEIAQPEEIFMDIPQYEVEAIEDEPLPKFEESNEEVIEIKNIDYEKNRRIIQRNQTTDYVLNILRYFPYVDPFRINLEGYNWWRVDFQDEAKGFLPYFSYLVGGEQKVRVRDNKVTTAKEMMAAYNHYLFGLYNQGDEVKYYVYAVPGGFHKDEHPNDGVTGFNTWFAGNEIVGYWLLFIDPLTGRVIYPVNPMKPME